MLALNDGAGAEVWLRLLVDHTSISGCTVQSFVFLHAATGKLPELTKFALSCVPERRSKAVTFLSQQRKHASGRRSLTPRCQCAVAVQLYRVFRGVLVRPYVGHPEMGLR